MARVRLCVCGSWFVGREGQAAHPRAPGQCLHFECRGAPARVRVWRCEGRPPLPHHFVCVEKFTLPTYVKGAPGSGQASRPTAQFIPFMDAKGQRHKVKGPLFNNPHSNPSTHKTRRAQLSRALPSALLARPTKPSGRTCLNSEPSLPPPRAFAHRKRRAPRLSERTTTSAAMTGVSPTSPASRREGFQLANPAARKSMNAQSYRTGSTRSNAHASACP